MVSDSVLQTTGSKLKLNTDLLVRGGGGGGVPSFLFRPIGCCCCCCCKGATCWWWCAGRLTGPKRRVSTSLSSLSSPSLSSSSSSRAPLLAFQSWKRNKAHIYNHSGPWGTSPHFELLPDFSSQNTLSLLHKTINYVTTRLSFEQWLK